MIQFPGIFSSGCFLDATSFHFFNSADVPSQALNLSAAVSNSYLGHSNSACALHVFIDTITYCLPGEASATLRTNPAVGPRGIGFQEQLSHILPMGPGFGAEAALNMRVRAPTAVAFPGSGVLCCVQSTRSNMWIHARGGVRNAAVPRRNSPA